MTRDYRKLARSSGVWVPRWVVWVVSVVIVFWLALRILLPPSWIIQQLESPDGNRAARLVRSRYLKQDSFVIRVRDGKLWRTVYYSAPLDDDLRIDLGERLFWTEDSSRLLFRISGRVIWGYDFEQRRSIQPDEND